MGEILVHHEKTMDLKIKTVIFMTFMMTSSVITIPDSVTTSHRGLIPILKTKLPPDREPFLLGDLALIEIHRNIVIHDPTTLMINIGSSTGTVSSLLTSISS